MALVSSGLPTNLGDMTATRKEGLRLDVLERDDEGKLLVSVLNPRTGEKLEGFLFRQVQEPNDGTAGLMSVGAWGCPKTEALPGAEDDHETDSESLSLLGSSVLPSLILIGDSELQLGEVVAAAHADSGLSVAEWNALPEGEIDKILDLWIENKRQQEALRVTTEQEKKALEAEREALEAEKAELEKERAQLVEEKAKVEAETSPSGLDPGKPDTDSGVPPARDIPPDASGGQSEAVNEGGVS